MIGPATNKNLPDPDLVSLYCDEVLPEDEPIEAEQPQEEPSVIYRVLIECPKCDRIIRLLCSADAPTIRGLELLFLGGLEIICPRCADKNGRP
nr:E7 protein [Rodent papillomavirus]